MPELRRFYGPAYVVSVVRAVCSPVYLRIEIVIVKDICAGKAYGSLWWATMRLLIVEIVSEFLVNFNVRKHYMLLRKIAEH